MKQRIWLANGFLFAACIALTIMGHCSEVEWTRLKGKVKGISLKASTVTLQNGDGDLITVPVDYQVQIAEKSGELKSLNNLQLDEKVVLTRVPKDKPREDTEGLALPEQTPRGR